jgi:hypothetical protein
MDEASFYEALSESFGENGLSSKAVQAGGGNIQEALFVAPSILNG